MVRQVHKVWNVLPFSKFIDQNNVLKKKSKKSKKNVTLLIGFHEKI